MAGTGKAYDHRCDLFSFGCLMYELAELALPFGMEPPYEDVRAEFRMPTLIDSANSAEIPHLFDLIVGLLDWNPSERLGGDDSLKRLKQLEQAPYWRTHGDGDRTSSEPDWEALGARRVPSPLAAHVKARLAATAAAKKPGRRRALTNFVGAAAPAKAEEVQMLLKSFEASKAAERASQLENNDTDVDLLEVEDWDYVSGHAIATEYVESDQVVSLV